MQTVNELTVALLLSKFGCKKIPSVLIMTCGSEDISSEDSNIITFFQSFDKDSIYISPVKDLSLIFASIELLIKDEVNFEKPLQLTKSVNNLYNLIIDLINLAGEFPSKLASDFLEYYENRINVIITKIVTPNLFNALYHLDNKHVDLIWQVYRIVGLFYGVFDNGLVGDRDDGGVGGGVGSNGSSGNYRFPIAPQISVIIIRYCQLSLFKYQGATETTTSSVDGNSNPYPFFKGGINLSFIIKKKLELIDQTVQILLENCQLDGEILRYFLLILSNKPTYFSLKVYVKHASIVFKRVATLPMSEEFREVRDICLSVDKAVGKALKHSGRANGLAEPVGPPRHSGPIGPTGPLRSVSVFDGVNDIHIDQEINRYVPNWVRFFEYDQRDFTQQNSDYSKKSIIVNSCVVHPPAPGSPSPPGSPSSPVSMPSPRSSEINKKHHHRLKQKFKQMFMPKEPSPKALEAQKSAPASVQKHSQSSLPHQSKLP